MTGETITATVNRPLLRLSATLLLAGQLLYVLVTLMHTGGEANDHPAIFTAYAASETWTAVHVAQFACMALVLGGLLGLFSAVEFRTPASRLAGRIGVAVTTATLALYGVVLAVDGVALKQAVTAWANAPAREKAALFAAAEAARWLEWGTRSYADYTLGAAVLFAAAVIRRALLPRPIACAMVLAGFSYFAQGWMVAAGGFSQAHTFAIVAAEVLNGTWMTSLLVVALRMPDSATAPAPIGGNALDRMPSCLTHQTKTRIAG